MKLNSLHIRILVNTWYSVRDCSKEATKQMVELGLLKEIPDRKWELTELGRKAVLAVFRDVEVEIPEKPAPEPSVVSDAVAQTALEKWYALSGTKPYSRDREAMRGVLEAVAGQLIDEPSCVYCLAGVPAKERDGRARHYNQVMMIWVDCTSPKRP